MHVIHRANNRGKADHGWLKSSFSFSFADYQNPQMMGFGALRVINDDSISPSNGFGSHPHKNMEIISIPLSGFLQHEDNLGNSYVVSHPEVQGMTAGTGIVHSEMNPSQTDECKFLQIWILPKKINVPPRYSHKKINLELNNFSLLVQPDYLARTDFENLSINQDAFISRAQITTEIVYKKYRPSNGVYLFVISGEVGVLDETLAARDALAITDDGDVIIKPNGMSDVLVIEVPTSEDK